LIGEVSIGSRSVVHPKAHIIAEAGPIIIGENNLIEEQARIINAFDEGGEDNSGIVRVMIIGNNNVFEVGSHSNALKIGDNNVLESKCFVGRSVVLSNGCIVGAGCKVTTEETMEENTVVYGAENSRRRQLDRPAPQTLQIDFLSKVLPNYHHCRKSSNKRL
jgi:dynactin-6